MMGRRGIAGIRAGRIRTPKIMELLFDLWMIAEMDSTDIIGSALVPAFDVIGNQRSALQRNSIEKNFDLFRRCRAGEFAVSNGADDFVTKWAVSERTADAGNEEQSRESYRRLYQAPNNAQQALGTSASTIHLHSAYRRYFNLKRVFHPGATRPRMLAADRAAWFVLTPVQIDLQRMNAGTDIRNEPFITPRFVIDGLGLDPKPGVVMQKLVV